MILKIAYIALYVLIGYYILVKGMNQYGGRDAYRNYCGKTFTYVMAVIVVIFLWPLVIIYSILRR